ncbi:MAG: hypothetical protein AD073_000292 [Mycoplasmataceae bacterium]|nr:MAG: hypothetical protein AD073_000292 [Mycoplasmataceae bacterium]
MFFMIKILMIKVEIALKKGEKNFNESSETNNVVKFGEWVKNMSNVKG